MPQMSTEPSNLYMSTKFDALTRAEKIAFWQAIEAKLRSVIDTCEGRISPHAAAEAGEYLDYNELGLAWETLCAAFSEADALTQALVDPLMRETGRKMGFEEARIDGCF